MSEQSEKFYKEKIEEVKKATTERETLANRWLELRKSYQHRPKGFAPIERGIIFTKKICPVCGSELKRIVLTESHNGFIRGIGLMYYEQRDLYACKKCKYEYAYEEGDDFN